MTTAKSPIASPNVIQGGAAFIYFLDDAGKQQRLPKMKETLVKLEGAGEVIEPDRFVKLGLPHADDNPQMGMAQKLKTIPRHRQSAARSVMWKT